MAPPERRNKSGNSMSHGRGQSNGASATGDYLQGSVRVTADDLRTRRSEDIGDTAMTTHSPLGRRNNIRKPMSPGHGQENTSLTGENRKGSDNVFSDVSQMVLGDDRGDKQKQISRMSRLGVLQSKKAAARPNEPPMQSEKPPHPPNSPSRKVLRNFVEPEPVITKTDSASTSPSSIADMDELLAPDSGDEDGHACISIDGSYGSRNDGGTSPDFIMRRVEEEIENARRATQAAQNSIDYLARMEDVALPHRHSHHSFEFNNSLPSQPSINPIDPIDSGDPVVVIDPVDSSDPTDLDVELAVAHLSKNGPATDDDMHNILDVFEKDSFETANDENFEGAMGVIGQEFGPEIEEETIDIEVVLTVSSTARGSGDDTYQETNSTKHNEPTTNSQIMPTEMHSEIEDLMDKYTVEDLSVDEIGSLMSPHQHMISWDDGSLLKDLSMRSTSMRDTSMRDRSMRSTSIREKSVCSSDVDINFNSEGITAILNEEHLSKTNVFSGAVNLEREKSDNREEEQLSSHQAGYHREDTYGIEVKPYESFRSQNEFAAEKEVIGIEPQTKAPLLSLDTETATVEKNLEDDTKTPKTSNRNQHANAEEIPRMIPSSSEFNTIASSTNQASSENNDKLKELLGRVQKLVGRVRAASSDLEPQSHLPSDEAKSEDRKAGICSPINEEESPLDESNDSDKTELRGIESLQQSLQALSNDEDHHHRDSDETTTDTIPMETDETLHTADIRQSQDTPIAVTEVVDVESEHEVTNSESEVGSRSTRGLVTTVLSESSSDQSKGERSAPHARELQSSPQAVETTPETQKDDINPKGKTPPELTELMESESGDQCLNEYQPQEDQKRHEDYRAITQYSNESFDQQPREDQGAVTPHSNESDQQPQEGQGAVTQYSNESLERKSLEDERAFSQRRTFDETLKSRLSPLTTCQTPTPKAHNLEKDSYNVDLLEQSNQPIDLKSHEDCNVHARGGHLDSTDSKVINSSTEEDIEKKAFRQPAQANGGVDPPQQSVKHEASNEEEESVAEITQSDSASEITQPRRIRLRDPYPTPKQNTQPRSGKDIIRDHVHPSHDRKRNWIHPNAELKKLLRAATDPSLPRRSNACGALKVITQLKKNKLALVRTSGFLQALVFAATTEISPSDPEATLDTRARAVSALFNVSDIKENRIIVFNQPGLPQCLVQLIKEDQGEARLHACGTLAQLAKNPVCRQEMVKVDNLISVLADVLRGTIDPIIQYDENLHDDDKEEEKKMDDDSEVNSIQRASSSYSETTSVASSENSFDKSSIAKRLLSKSKKFQVPIRNPALYEEHLRLSRMSACAALLHLSRHCSISDTLCSHQGLKECLVEISLNGDDPMNPKCLEILFNLTRFPPNIFSLARFPRLVEALIKAAQSSESNNRVWALQSLQNISADGSCKAILATSTLLKLLTGCVTSNNFEEQHAAMATLFNISTEPSAVVPITSTKNVVASLVHFAHTPEAPSVIRLMACNALATVGLWLQTVSGFGTVPKEVKDVTIPSHKTSGWELWDP